MGNSSFFFFPVQALIMQKLTDNRRLYQVSYPSSALACRRQNRPSLAQHRPKGIVRTRFELEAFDDRSCATRNSTEWVRECSPAVFGMRSRNRFLHARTRDVEGISRAQWYLCVSYGWDMWTMAARETKRRFLVRWLLLMAVSRQAMQPQKGVMLGLESSLAAPSQTASTRPAEMARSKLQSTDRGDSIWSFNVAPYA